MAYLSSILSALINGIQFANLLERRLVLTHLVSSPSFGVNSISKSFTYNL